MKQSQAISEEFSKEGSVFLADCQAFVSQLQLSIGAIQLSSMELHYHEEMPGWRGLVDLSGKGDGDTPLQIQIRYAWSDAIFRQNLVDFGCNQLGTLFPRNSKIRNRRLIIIYLCETTTGLLEPRKVSPIPSGFLIGNRWQEVLHFYIKIPLAHPFRAPTFLCVPPIGGDIQPEVLHTAHPVSLPLTSPLSDHQERLGEGGRRTKGWNRLSHAQHPWVTIITVVYNGARFLEQAIQSVINQSYPQLEYIVIDGGSSDGSLDILKKYDDYIDYWVSEPDQGIYPAMNKGWRLSWGDYVGFLGSDDVLSQLPIVALQQAFFEGFDFVYGTVYLDNGRLFRSKYGKGLALNNTIPHQGQLVRRSFSETGPFDERFRHYADFDLNQRLYLQKRTACSWPHPVALFRLSGAGGRSGPREFFKVIRKNFGLAVVLFSFAYLKLRGIAFRLRGWRS